MSNYPDVLNCSKLGTLIMLQLDDQRIKFLLPAALESVLLATQSIPAPDVTQLPIQQLSDALSLVGKTPKL
jgi:hypothetical protein